MYQILGRTIHLLHLFRQNYKTRFTIQLKEVALRVPSLEE